MSISITEFISAFSGRLLAFMQHSDSFERAVVVHRFWLCFQQYSFCCSSPLCIGFTPVRLALKEINFDALLIG